jgi:para-nitrobenzyl esterase
MIARSLPALLLLLALSACTDSPPSYEAAPESSREISAGTLTGFADSGDTWTWLGIPYARPPVGALRWRAPLPAQPWEGELQATAWSAMCPQLPIPLVNRTSRSWLGDEDCLYLNVSAPRSWQAGDPPLPVMVWMHGGGNSVGDAGQYPALRNLAATGQVITVSIHYRLGILGWFSAPALRELADNPLDASGNFGTLDTILALQWVQDNIDVFGGDPGKVTVFGESAGGINTFALLLSPLAEGLFHRAISQSGILVTNATELAENPVDGAPAGHPNSSGELLLRLLLDEGLANDRQAATDLLATWSAQQTMQYLRSKPPEVLLQQMQNREMGLYPFPFHLRDGLVLPAGDPLEQLRAGQFNRVPVIMGTNRDEMKTMLSRNPDYIDMRFGLLPRVSDQALYDRATSYGSAMWKAEGADQPARAMWEAGHREVFVYRFDWDEAPSGWLLDLPSLLGAAHSFEIPFVFSDLDNEMTFLPFGLFDEDNMAGAKPLAQAMTSYWLQFARAGQPGRGWRETLPGWPSWEVRENFLVFDSAHSGGIRAAQGGEHPAAIFARLEGDGAALGGPQGVCRAYLASFGADAIFQQSSQCQGDSCPGAQRRFCPPGEGPAATDTD